ncbi:MAG: ProQ/FinO family protein [Pseudomonadota bacterium]
MNTSNPAPDTSPAAALTPAHSARNLLKEFQAKFPAFREFMPLAIGIDKQLLARFPELDRKVLRIALGIHTNSSQYLKAMAKATARVDLDGNKADEVTEAHRTHAADTLRERFKKADELRKAQRAAESAQREAEEAARVRAEKLSQLTEKFSRNK